jgi:iron complex outermembrane receptor protein
LFSYELVDEVQSSKVLGRYSISDALQQLLKGTNLSGQLTERGVIVVAPVGAQYKGRERMNMKRNLLASSIAVFLGAGGIGYLGAAEMDTGSDGASFQEIDEIVVTASRREESLQNVGMSVSAVDPEAFTGVGLIKLEDVVAYTPGVSMSSAAGGPDGRELSIRGVNTGNILSAGTTPVGSPVGVYMDGTSLTFSSPYATGATIAFDGLLGDIERVEFLRGPQGTLYGASSMGGAVKYISRKPSLEGVRGHLAADISSIDEGGTSTLYNGRFSLPIIDNKLGFTVAGFIDDDEGFVDRVDSAGNVIEEDADNSERYGFSGDLYYQYSDRVDLRARILEQKIDFSGVSRIILDTATAKPLYGDFKGDAPFAENSRETTLYSATLGVEFDSAIFTAVSSYVESEFSRLSVNASPSAVQLYSPGTLLSPFGFDPLAASGRTFTGPATSADGVTDQSVERFTQEFQLTSAPNESLEWMVGLYYADEETFSSDSQVVQPDGFLIIDQRRKSFYEELAAFGNVTYYLTSDFDLTLGARLSDVEATLKAATVNNLFPSGEPLDNPIEDTVDTWSLTARYRPADNLSLYARAASGYRPAFATTATSGLNDDSELEFAPLKVESDTLWSYEVGAKGDLAEGLVSYDIALWLTKWDDYQTAIDRGPFFGYTGNASSGLTGQGLEASVVLSPFEGFTLVTNLAYTEMTLDEDDPGLQGSEGQQFPNVPEWMASSRGIYRFAVTDKVDGNVGLGVRYQDSTRGDFDVDFESDSYVVVDANAGLSWDKVSLSFYATNLLNEKALTNLNILTFRGVAVSGFAVPLQPRTVGAGITFDF